MSDRGEHDQPEQHGERRDPQELVAEHGAGEQGGSRRPAAERHRALHVSGADQSGETSPARRPRRLLQFGQLPSLGGQNGRVGRVGHPETDPQVVPLGGGQLVRHVG